MLGCSEARRSCWEVRDVVFFFVPDCCEIDDHDLIALLLCLSGYDVVNLDIPIGDVVLVQVVDCLTYLQKNYTGDIPQSVGLVLSDQILHHFGISHVTLLQLPPLHDLPQVA